MLARIAHGSVAIVVLAVVGCDSSTTPLIEPTGDLYTLQSIANVDLPAPYAVYLPHPNRMMSGYLTLAEDGTGEWHAVIELEVGGATFDEDVAVLYSRSGNDVTIHFACPDVADCIPGPHLEGTLSDGGHTITTSSIMRTPLVFETSPHLPTTR